MEVLPGEAGTKVETWGQEGKAAQQGCGHRPSAGLGPRGRWSINDGL